MVTRHNLLQRSAPHSMCPSMVLRFSNWGERGKRKPFSSTTS